MNIFSYFRNIIPFLNKHGVNPITGSPLKRNELIKVIFYKNDKDEFADPISFKVFNENTHLALIRPSGYVYCYDTID
jgi:peptidyl-prolyl cis-trans isomerase-like protein 2